MRQSCESPKKRRVTVTVQYAVPAAVTPAANPAAKWEHAEQLSEHSIGS